MSAPPSALPSWLRIGTGSITLQATARPGSSQRGIVGLGPSGLAVAVHARAIEGRANAELVEVLAAALSVPRSSIVLERGERGRAKLFRIKCPNPRAIAEKIKGLARRPDFEENSVGERSR
ncbi:MAG TPA: DUF167 domain-containing protein [Candidatus Binataceae bacterium]|nr:DUF167 domain-containing protein [Candidatus Binataceae bacterium]